MSLEDGKQPLFIWIAAIFQKFIADPLIASRLVSVFAGFGSLVGIYLLTKTLFNKKTALLACLLYIILPFTLLYDRIALFDSLLTMFGIWAVFFSVKMARSPQLDTALLNGFAIGLGMITKSSANFFLYLLPFSLLLFEYKQGNRPQRIIKWSLLTLITVILAFVIFNSLRLSPLFYMIDRKNHEFIRSLMEVLGNPTIQFPGNFKTLILWLVQYNGWPLLFLAILTVIWAFARKHLSIIFLSIYIAAPFLAESLFNKIIYPRFMLFYFPFIVIIIAFAATNFLSLKKSYYKFLWIIFLILIIINPLFASYRLLTNPPRAKIADSDLAQYFNSWPAGYGVDEIVKIVKEESKHQDVVVGTQGTFGLLPFAIQIYFYNYHNVQIIGYWPVSDIPVQILEIAKTKKTFFVFNENQNLPDEPKNPSLKLIGKYQKGIGNSFMRLYEIIPQ
jgi:4-amino-4-deoxy-L-arabinose transferase-like glycosyltransferase